MFSKGQQGSYRPVVRMAWLEHCRSSGLPPNSKSSYEPWYRQHVRSVIGSCTTRDADPLHDFLPLLDHFILLAGQVHAPCISGWTPKQQHAFQELSSRAWMAELRNCDIGENVDFDGWISKFLEGTGIHRMRASDRTESFDLVMASLAVVAGSDYWISRTASASETRMRHLIRIRMSDLSRLSGSVVDWPYVRAIYTHMRLPMTLEDASASWLKKVFQALDTQVRRLQRSHPPAQSPDTADYSQTVEIQISFHHILPNSSHHPSPST